ncbi:hypothetical protein DER46DRAFT_574914 [Fusarium sp. MPI-SDFR-AT-0072]|nr:hypothetical protein DER46DRAFT_574914 [Fusarium sp. MPI-SDFR-AT-0072]
MTRFARQVHVLRQTSHTRQRVATSGEIAERTVRESSTESTTNIRTDANQVSKTPSRRYKQRNASEESDGDAKHQIVVLTRVFCWSPQLPISMLVPEAMIGKCPTGPNICDVPQAGLEISKFLVQIRPSLLVDKFDAGQTPLQRTLQLLMEYRPQVSFQKSARRLVALLTSSVLLIDMVASRMIGTDEQMRREELSAAQKSNIAWNLRTKAHSKIHGAGHVLK